MGRAGVVRPVPVAGVVGVLAAAVSGAALGGERPGAARPLPPEQSAFFEREIRPLLAAECYGCHGEKVRQGGLRLDSREALLKGGGRGPAVVPGDPAGSLLLKTLDHAGALKMPPARKLAPAQVAALAAWVKQGAPWPAAGTRSPGDPRAHWAFQPVKRPAVPAVKDRAWVRTPIDAFVLADLERRGLRPAPPADRRTLLRRATFDMLGLPPTPEEVDAFVSDRSPGAWEKVVDRLLASPHYGERWGRHWLDVVRYADTAGETADYPVPEAYRYRDYVIRAFNEDLPWNEFLREQVAGDLLAAREPGRRYNERITATGYLAIARRFGFDPQNYHHLTLEDTIDTLGKSMLGMSLGCARCHDHKYDPVSMRDYYGLYGIFASTRYPFPGSEERKRPADFVPLPPPEEAARLKAEFDQRRAQLELEKSVLEKERTALLARVAQDAGMEFQAAGELLALPWNNGPNSLARVSTEAQSPFAHLLPPGRHGIAFSNTAAYSGFGQALPAAWTAQKARVLHYNADFRNASAAAGGAGSHRFYVGHGPGPSPAMELFVSGDGFFVRNGGRIERVLDLAPGKWYSVQVTLDLETRTYSGTVGSPGALTRFENIAFAPGWDGAIDYFFVDSYGHVGGVRPALHVDNLAIREAPIPPPVLGSGAPAPADTAALDRGRSLAARISVLEGELAAMTERGPYPLVYAVAEGTPADTRIQLRGDPRQPGDVAPRGLPRALGGRDLGPGAAGSGRLALADWLASPANPLTARVAVNRVWLHHFGRGLVRTPNDFGLRGERPTNPELLDWLASVFAAPLAAGGSDPASPGEEVPSPGRAGASENRSPSALRRPGTRDPGPGTPIPQPPSSNLGWSLKKLHRLILLSSAYQRASAPPPAAAGGKPSPRWDTFPRRRLDAEAVRDALLSVGGLLDPTPGGPHPFPKVATWGFTQHAPFTAVYETNRRSVYLMTQRIRRHPFLALFDGADPNTSTGERFVTTTPLQALFSLNDPLVHRAAAGLAARARAAGSPGAGVDRMFRLCFARAPQPEEARDCTSFLQAARDALQETGKPADTVESAAWEALARALLESNEFLFVD